MSKIYRNLVLAFVLTTGLLFLSLSIGMVVSNIESENKYLEDIAVQVVKNIDSSKTKYHTKLNQMKTVWAQKGLDAEYILSAKKEASTQESLLRMRTIVGASQVHILDGEGRVMLSTDNSAVGSPIQGEEEAVRELIDSKTPGGYYVHIEDNGFWKDPTFCRLLMKSTSEDYAAVCFEADITQMGLKCEKTIIENTLFEAATEYDTSVVAVGQDSGVILGMTSNNEQRLEIEGVKNARERIAYLEEISQRDTILVDINGERNLMFVTEMDGAFIVAFTSLDEILKLTAEQWMRVFLIFLADIGIMMATIYYNFRKYLLNDLEQTENQLNEILEGNYDAEIKEGNNKEINKLLRVIDRLKMGYIHKSERMDKILEVLGDDVAVFECVFKMNYCFFSDKMQSMLGMSDEEWEKAQDDRGQLVSLLTSLNERKDENDIVFYKGKYLEVQVYLMEQELVGVLINQTDEVTRRFHLETELRESEKKRDTDELTGILNRRGFESCVRRYLEASEEGGVLILFDLDNFKNINDSLGHPAGDEALQIFAKGLKQLFRRRDVIARFGGDEFAVFMFNTMERESLERKLTLSLAALNDKFGEFHTKYGLSVSAGVAFAVRGIDYETLYQDADGALYAAKNAGKARYFICPQQTDR